MHCTNCGILLQEGARFCPSCGHAIGSAAAPPPQAVPTRLVRSRSQRKIAGVCAAVARYLNWDVTLVRILWVVLVFGAGTGFVAYLIGWILIPAGE